MHLHAFLLAQRRARIQRWKSKIFHPENNLQTQLMRGTISFHGDCQTPWSSPMILYRARTMSSKPGRFREYAGHHPEARLLGRWFTRSLSAAIAYRDSLALEEPAEIIAVEIPDDIAESFRVETHPVTACKIEVLTKSQDPHNDYVLPLFHQSNAMTVLVDGEAGSRIRDYIHITPAAAQDKVLRVTKPEAPKYLLAA